MIVIAVGLFMGAYRVSVYSLVDWCYLGTNIGEAVIRVKSIIVFVSLIKDIVIPKTENVVIPQKGKGIFT